MDDIFFFEKKSYIFGIFTGICAEIGYFCQFIGIFSQLKEKRKKSQFSARERERESSPARRTGSCGTVSYELAMRDRIHLGYLGEGNGS